MHQLMDPITNGRLFFLENYFIELTYKTFIGGQPINDRWQLNFFYQFAVICILYGAVGRQFFLVDIHD